MRLRRSLWIGALVAPMWPTLVFAQAPSPAPVEDEGDAPDPARPPPAGKGVVWGVVRSQKTKEPVIEALVTVTATKKRVQADLDGRYRLELPPGTYALRVFYEGFKPRRVDGIVVKKGVVTKLDIALPPDEKAQVEEVVEIDVTPDRASPAAQLEMRKNAAYAGDAISAADIAKSPDRNAADAARRVVGATLVDGKYLVVRGLGERYTNTLLNGVPLPSPEPDRQAVPLDIFPSLVLSDIQIAKTFTPDMPADFAGGSVRIHTRELPRSFFVQANVWMGANTQSTFASRLTYDGSSMDGFGIDGRARGFPGNVPDYKIGRGLTHPDGSYITPEQLTAYGRSINSTMVTRHTITGPHIRANLAAGNTWKVGGGQEIGAVVAATYSRRFQRQVGEKRATYDKREEEGGKLKANTDYGLESSTDYVGWSAYGALTWAPDSRNKVSLTGLHNRSSSNEARIVKGFNDERGADITDTRLRFETRSLTFGNLSGTHKIKGANDGVLDWAGFASLATSDEPDTRETVYVHDNQLGVDAWDRGTLSGSHFWGAQRERAYGGMLDWTQPLIKGDQFTKLKIGGLVSRKSRTFDARRFRFINRQGTPAETYNLPADKLFSRENIGTALEIEEYTKPNDAYDAGHAIYAGYLMADSWVLPRLRITVGARLEASRQSLDSFDPHAAELTSSRTELNTTDLLPSLNVVVKVRKDINVRLAATRTVARPQLRELSPFVFTDYFGARDVYGNPHLQRTSIYNGDARFEVFPGSGEVLAVSAFYKQFYGPIEAVVQPTGGAGAVSFQNSDSARVMGVELEARKGLGFLHAAMKDITVLWNLTLATSRVLIDPKQSESGIQTQQTSNDRPLQGQSPWVVNAGIDFSPEAWGLRARVLYNILGPRIAEVGAYRVPDTYERPRHQLDLFLAKSVGKHIDLKFTAENILDAPVRLTQSAGGQTVIAKQYKTGATVFLGVEYTN
jgi:hypothetical protein